MEVEGAAQEEEDGNSALPFLIFVYLLHGSVYEWSNTHFPFTNSSYTVGKLEGVSNICLLYAM